MRVWNGGLRMLAALFCLHLWLACEAYLSECVPDLTFEHEITRVWWDRAAESIVLKENEWVSPGRDYRETGYDYSYAFRLSEGAVLSMEYDCHHMRIAERDLRAAEAAGGAPAEGTHTLWVGYGAEDCCLLDGKPLPASCHRVYAGKVVHVKNEGAGEIALSDLRVEFPRWRNPRPLQTRKAPRTAEELLYRAKIWARYLCYSCAPPPLPISAHPPGELPMSRWSN